MNLLDKEQYLNIIELLERTLQFYGNEENYTANNPINREIISLIEVDNGEQARFILNQVNEIKKTLQGINSNYDDLIQGANDQIDAEEIIKKMKDIKNQ